MNTHPVLLVEDSPEDREATLRALKKSGISNTVHWCQNGGEALDYLMRRGRYANPSSSPRPSIVLLDLNLPGSDGREVLHHVKSHPELRSIPVVILTTSLDDQDIRSCYGSGANSYVQKPVNPEHFVVAIRQLVVYWFETVVLPSPPCP